MNNAAKPRLGRPRDPERMRRVLEAAEQLFLEQGFERTSVDAVARASGISKMTIYSYFPTKKELFEAVIGRRVGVAFDFEDQPVPTPEDPRTGLTLIARHFLSLTRADDVICKQRVLIAEAGVQHEACMAFFERGPLAVVARVREYLDAAVAAGGLRPHDTSVGADQFLSLFLGLSDIRAMLGLGKPTADEDERLIERNVEMFMRAYGPN